MNCSPLTLMSKMILLMWFFIKAKKMDAGIEKINPTMVVIRAIEIPFANSDGFGVLAELAITEKDATIPSTVPSNPTDGATAAIKPT